VFFYVFGLRSISPTKRESGTIKIICLSREESAIFRASYFSSDIPPACTYCRYGFPSRDSERILCERVGIVPPDYSCRRFIYCPLKRIPKRAPKLPSYTKEDFEL
jgi:hypothetical protein